MKKSWAMKWIKALRSGKYKQTTGSLRDDKGHCCLGVLCAITPYKYNYTKLHKTTLPNKVINLVGTMDSNPWVKVKGNPHVTTLANLNDIQHKSFAEIADIIEQNWKKL